MHEARKIKDFKVLKFLDNFAPFFKKAGINYNIMRRLLQIMLTMDGRRTTTLMASQARKDKEDKNLFSSYLLTYGILGVFIGIFMIAPFSIFYRMSAIFGMIMFMVLTTMICDFSSVLLDTKDKTILTPRPIDSRTINAAKTLHILIYLVVITSIIAGPAFIVGIFRYGFLFSAVFLAQLLTMAFFVIFLTSILYYLVLRFFDGEKLKDVINFFQILLSIIMMVGYQLIGRAFSLYNLDLVFTPKWWSYLIPPLWFGAPYSILLEGNFDRPYIVLSVLCILVPLTLFFIYAFIINPYFERGLQKLASVNKKRADFIEKKTNIKRKFAAIICRDRLENIFFRFTDSMAANERGLKLKLYPSLAYGAIIPIIFLFTLLTSGRPFWENYKDLTGSNYFLYIYISVAILSSMYITIYTSEKYKGAWIYRVLPIESPMAIFRGSMKSFIIKYFLPVFTFISIVYSLLFGARIIPHLAAIFINLLILTVINFMMSTKELPFSIKAMPQQEGALSRMLVSFVYCGLSAFIQYFAAKISYGLWVYIGILAAAFIILWVRGTKLKWSDVVGV